MSRPPNPIFENNVGHVTVILLNAENFEETVRTYYLLHWYVPIHPEIFRLMHVTIIREQTQRSCLVKIV
jgi:hypothetical protein